jgi:2-methylisocitrate lyase-like PEP mutase family enzyme
MTETRKRFRELIAAPETLVMPGAYDALSARIIEREGFQAAAAGGYAALGSMLAEADMGQSNMRDMADHYARVCAAVSIPVLVDADDFAGMFRKLDALGYRGHFTTAFGSLQDMIEGREYLVREGHKAGLA